MPENYMIAKKKNIVSILVENKKQNFKNEVITCKKHISTCSNTPPVTVNFNGTFQNCVFMTASNYEERLPINNQESDAVCINLVGVSD